MKLPSNIRELVKELLKTLSNEKSLFASKRIERFCLMGSIFTIAIGTWIYLMCMKTLTSTDACIIIVPLLGAAGYNSFRTYKDKKLEEDGNSKDGTS